MTPGFEVLLVDDEPIVGKRLRTALERAGYRVEVCETGASALARIEEHAHDIVVTDIRIDEVDGIEILKAVKARRPETPTILITGYATVEVAREALARGAFDFLAKPFRPKDLLRVVDRAAAQIEERGGKGGPAEGP